MSTQVTLEEVAHRELVEKLEKRVEYYEMMHADARLAIKIAGNMSLEMKERRIEAQIELDRARKDKPKAETGC